MSFPIILVPEAAQVWHLNQQIAQFETFPLEQQRLIQAQSLRALLAWAAEHSLFWHEHLRSVGWVPESDPWLILERNWGRYSYRTVVGPAKAGLFKEEGKESEENEEKRVGSWQLKIK